MKTIKINANTYTMTRTGYGQYTVTKTNKRGTEYRHSTDSQMYDWMDDDSDRHQHASAKRALKWIFN